MQLAEQIVELHSQLMPSSSKYQFLTPPFVIKFSILERLIFRSVSSFQITFSFYHCIYLGTINCSLQVNAEAINLISCFVANSAFEHFSQIGSAYYQWRSIYILIATLDPPVQSSQTQTHYAHYITFELAAHRVIITLFRSNITNLPIY